MHAISLEYLRNNLDDAIAMAEVGELIITRDTGSNLILLSESDWRTLQEIAHLFSTPLNAERLQISLETSRADAQNKVRQNEITP